ncbi:MAG: hypothetical protein GY698_03925 [Actinomycetia bacterium]|nr:hypothetical protein [Actinomycetes bacterium]
MAPPWGRHHHRSRCGCRHHRCPVHRFQWKRRGGSRGFLQRPGPGALVLDRRRSHRGGNQGRAGILQRSGRIHDRGGFDVVEQLLELVEQFHELHGWGGGRLRSPTPAPGHGPPHHQCTGLDHHHQPGAHLHHRAQGQLVHHVHERQADHNHHWAHHHHDPAGCHHRPDYDDGAYDYDDYAYDDCIYDYDDYAYDDCIYDYDDYAYDDCIYDYDDCIYDYDDCAYDDYDDCAYDDYNDCAYDDYDDGCTYDDDDGCTYDDDCTYDDYWRIGLNHRLIPLAAGPTR